MFYTTVFNRLHQVAYKEVSFGEKKEYIVATVVCCQIYCRFVPYVV